MLKVQVSYGVGDICNILQCISRFTIQPVILCEEINKPQDNILSQKSYYSKILQYLPSISACLFVVETRVFSVPQADWNNLGILSPFLLKNNNNNSPVLYSAIVILTSQSCLNPCSVYSSFVIKTHHTTLHPPNLPLSSHSNPSHSTLFKASRTLKNPSFPTWTQCILDTSLLPVLLFPEFYLTHLSHEALVAKGDLSNSVQMLNPNKSTHPTLRFYGYCLHIHHGSIFQSTGVDLDISPPPLHLFISRCSLVNSSLSLGFCTNLIFVFGRKHDENNNREPQGLTNT